MNKYTSRKMVMISLATILVLSACARGAETATVEELPSEEAIVMNTSTPAATFTPADTPTPPPTATSTYTPEPTATSTPNVTPTLLPEYTPPTEGKGNIIGLVLWNGAPVPQAAVWLCEKFEGSCKGTYQYRANTDKNGYYIFKNVMPGEYLVAINSFSTGWFIFYFDEDGNRMQEVSAGEDLILEPWSIWKFDLVAVSPQNGKDLAEPHPTFTWNAYPGAAYYVFSIYDTQFNDVLVDVRVDGTEYTLNEATLVTCSYYWTVEAYNAEGVKISQLKAPRSTVMKLIIHSVPGTC